MAKKTYVLWASSENSKRVAGPLATGDLEALKDYAEKEVASIVGSTRFLWEMLDKEEDRDPVNRWVLTRKGGPDRWVRMPYVIDEVPVLAAKQKAKV